MCLAIYRPPNQQIPQSYFIKASARNPHGMGLCYSDKDKIIIKKGFFNVKDFWKAYQQVPNDVSVAIHFRMATHGLINKRNCHPFKINDNYALIHNGMIPHFGTSRLSDTGDYTENFLSPLFGMLDLDKIDLNHKAFETFIYLTSQANKIVIIGAKGDDKIFGEKGGDWIDDVWYSNLYSIGYAGYSNTQLTLTEQREVENELTEEQELLEQERGRFLTTEEIDSLRKSLNF